MRTFLVPMRFPVSRLLTCILLLCTLRTAAQERQTYQRLRYHHYHWKAFHTEPFHVYFPEGDDSLCVAVVRDLPTAIKAVGRNMSVTLQQTVNVVIYPSLTALYESNIGSTETRDVTFPTFIRKGNRIALAYNGSYTDLKRQLYEGLARAGWEAQLSDNISTQALSGNQIPYWISEGSIRYFAHGWPLTAEDDLLHALHQEQPAVWEAFIARHPALGGQAFCTFLANTYLPQTPAQLFQQFRKKKPLARALRLITQTPADSLYAACLQYYSARAAAIPFTKDSTRSTTSVASWHHRHGTILRVLMQEGGNNIAVLTATGHTRNVTVYDPRSHRQTSIITYTLPPWIADHSTDPYPLMSWAGQELMVLMPVKGVLTVRSYNTNGQQHDHFPLEGIDGISSLSSAGNGEWLLAAWRKAQSDIVACRLQKDKYTPLTYDRGDDCHPALSSTGNLLLFTSERLMPQSRKEQRLSDTVVFTQGIFRARDREVAPWITDTIPYLRYDHPTLLQDNAVLFTSTALGTAQFVSSGNLQSPANSLQRLGAVRPIQYMPGTEEIIQYTDHADTLQVWRTPFATWTANNLDTTDSIAPWLVSYRAAAASHAREDSILKAASGANQPSFLGAVLSGGKQCAQAARRADSLKLALQYSDKKTEPYVLQLYSAYFTAKVNNDYFINRYQPYQSYQGMFRFPGTGGMAQGGFSDLFENHHFTVAFRLPAGSEGSDFFVRYRNTTKRTEWGLAYYRESEDLKPDPLRQWVDESGRPYPNTAKVKTNYFEVSASYPLNYYSSINLTTAIRHDKTVFSATERYSLDFPSYKSLWSVTSASYTLEKLRPTLPMLYRGFTARIVGDVFKGITQKEEALAGGNVQLSYHQPLYRYITLVVRAQAGASAGDARVLYNLGGVDNNITPRIDSTVHFSQTAPFAFQTLVTPFRGYYQNSLYGSRYSLLNADVYFPLFQSLIPVETPLPSLNNLQLGIFADAASAGGAKAYTTAARGWLMSYGLSARTTLAGYPLRFDLAWPGTFRAAPVWYLSLAIK